MTSNTVQPRQLGQAGPSVFPIGLGCMGMSGMYGPSDDAESLATLRAALDAGINLLDTGDFYGMGHNESLIARAIEGRRDQVVLSVKFGAQRGPDGSWLGFDGRPAAVKNALAYSLQRLRTDHVDIYRPARLDPAVPVEDTMGAIRDLVKAGYVRHAGLSEVSADTIRRASTVQPITDLQIEYSLIARGVEKQIIPALQEHGIGMTAYGVLGRGLLSGSAPTGRGDFRMWLPRFRGDNFEQNRKIAATLRDLAGDHDATPSQLAIAWVLAQGDSIVPLVGARTRAQLADALAALRLNLSAEDLAYVGEAVSPEAVVGTRYDAHGMRMLDSER